MGKKEEIIAEFGEDTELIFYDGLDEAIIGTASRINLGPVVVYDTSKIIEILILEGLTHDEALEHYHFNIAGGYIGEATPLFLDILKDD